MRVALFGLGFMGRTHLTALRSIPGAKLAAVFVPDIEQIHAVVQGNLGGEAKPLDLEDAKVYTSVAETLADPGIDAVDICLPTHLHAETAIAALEAGKHVLVEKPMAVDPLSAAEVIEAAKKAKKTLMAAHVLRFFPEYHPLREAITKGDLGQLRMLTLRRSCGAPTWGDWFYDSSKSGGAVLDLLIHDADMALSLVGFPRAISSTGYRDMRRGIDVVSAHLDYERGPAVVIAGGWNSPKAFPFSMGYTAAFDEGTLEFTSLGGGVMLHRAGGPPEPVSLPAADAYADEIRYFLECCAQGREPERCPPEQSAQAIDICLRMAEGRLAHR